MEIFYNDKSLDNDKDYQEFISNSPGKGYLKIRATSANEAVPVEGLNIRVSKDIGNNKIIFYEGVTDYSGMINDIVLPAPPSIKSDLEIPIFNTYRLEAYNNIFKQEYNISVCCSFTIIQYINVIPNMETSYGY